MSLAAVKSSAADFYAAQFTDAQARLPGANVAWLAELRQRAFADFARLGFPTTRHEEWKYSNLAPLERRQFSLAASTTLFDPTVVRAHDVLGGALLVFVNGHFQPVLSRLDALPSGVQVGSMARVLHREPDCLRSSLERDAPSRHSLLALNAALFSDGACVLLAPGVQIDAPIHLLFVHTAADCTAQPLNVLSVGAGSRATIVEHHVGASESQYWSNAATRIELGANAQLQHINVSRHGGKAFHTASIDADLAAGSVLSSLAFALSGQFYRQDIAVRLAGEGANCTLNGLYVAAAREHVDFHTYIDHALPGGTSREFYKGVLADAARAVFNGKVIVRQDAQQSDAQQSNKNLLLSEDAEIDTKPQLEIFADDVKCSHGATVGQLDDDQIFYLRARGLSADAARSVLTYAFCEEIVAQVPQTALRQYINQALLGRLPDGDKLVEMI